MTGYRPSRLRIGREGLGEAPREEDAAYNRWYITMNLIFGAAVVLAIFVVLIDQGEPWSNRITAIGLALLLVGWFTWMGQWSRIHTDLQVVTYFTVAVLLIALAINQHNGFGLLLFAAYWQGFAYLRIPAALVYATLLTLASQWGFGNVQLDSPGDVVSNPAIVTIAVVALIVSGLMAYYIETIATEADRRAELLKQLREAQDALARREREAGVQEERQRLAGEIHDTIAQQFTSIVTNLEAAEARARSNPDAAQDHLHAAREAARQGIADARALVHALQPEILEGRSLGEALHHIATTSNMPTGTTVTFREEGQPVPLDRVRETVLVRALQESLQNVRKHAGACNVVATLSWLDDEVILDIQDDGAGFDPDAVPPTETGHRMGLRSMKLRVENAGGTFMIDAAPGEGTSLAVSFPIERKDESQDVTG